MSKTYYGVLRTQPAWVLIQADSLVQAKRKLSKAYPDKELLLCKRATPGDIDFVKWCEYSEEQRKKREQPGDTGEQGLACSGVRSETTEEITLVD